MDISKETRKSFKFYTSLILGWILLMVGMYYPPAGEISSGALIAGGMVLCISAGCIGVDLAEIIHQLTLLKQKK